MTDSAGPLADLIQRRIEAALDSQMKGDLARAERTFREVLGVDRGNLYASNLLGLLMQQSGRHDEALALFTAATAHRIPQAADAWSNRGNLLRALGRAEEACASYREALSLDPDHANAWANLGNGLHEAGRSPEAIGCYDRAIRLIPGHAQAWSNRGHALNEIGQLEESLASYERAVALCPDHADFRRNRGLHHLLMGDFERGLADYEARELLDERRHRVFSAPRWRGETAIAGKTVLVWDEQGLGDTIQFARYLRPLAAAGAQVLFAPQPELRALMRSLDAPCAIVDAQDPALAYDLHCSLLSLPLAFATRLETIPAEVPYLRPEAARVDRWRDRLGADGFRVGICWQGNVGRVDRGRSFPLALLGSIAALPDVRLISLHKGAGEAQLAELPAGMTVERPGEDFDAGSDAFLDTAAIMACCDLVISSDTAAAHLAGALARPVWLALKHAADWRWLLERSDSPWYPTMRLFRQPAAGDWTAVFAAMASALRRQSA